MKIERILLAVNSPNGREAAFDALALAKSADAELSRFTPSLRISRSRWVVPTGWSGCRICATCGERRRARADSRQPATRQKSSSSMPTRVRRIPSSWVARHAVVGAAIAGWSPKVIPHTRLPALVVPSDAPDTLADFGNVLVAVDLSPASETSSGVLLD